MADEKAKADAPAPAEGQAAPKKKIPKTALFVVAILLLEAVTVVITFSMSGGPATAKADRQIAALVDDSNQQVEELVLEDKFPNSRRGDVYLYDTQIYAVVRKKHQEKVKGQIKSMSAQIHADLGTVFRRADPSFMHEDELQTLTRQIKAVLDERFGRDPEGEPVIQRIVITKCTEYRIEF